MEVHGNVQRLLDRDGACASSTAHPSHPVPLPLTAREPLSQVTRRAAKTLRTSRGPASTRRTSTPRATRGPLRHGICGGGSGASRPPPLSPRAHSPPPHPPCSPPSCAPRARSAAAVAPPHRRAHARHRRCSPLVCPSRSWGERRGSARLGAAMRRPRRFCALFDRICSSCGRVAVATPSGRCAPAERRLAGGFRPAGAVGERGPAQGWRGGRGYR